MKTFIGWGYGVLLMVVAMALLALSRATISGRGHSGNGWRPPGCPKRQREMGVPPGQGHEGDRRSESRFKGRGQISDEKTVSIEVKGEPKKADQKRNRGVQKDQGSDYLE